MLVLSRKVTQRIVVGDVVFVIVAVAGKRVSVGIEAPPDVRIARGELVDAERVEDTAVAA